MGWLLPVLAVLVPLACSPGLGDAFELPKLFFLKLGLVLALLALLAGVVALVLAYLVTYGFTTWALPGYTRTVGRVFEPDVVVVFLVKTLLFALAIVLVPLGSALYDDTRSRISAEVRGLVRLFALLLLIEAASLAANYG